MKTELISSLMPAFLSLLGVGFGAIALFAPNIPDNVRVNAIGVAGTAIAGAAGLAQPERHG